MVLRTNLYASKIFHKAWIHIFYYLGFILSGLFPTILDICVLTNASEAPQITLESKNQWLNISCIIPKPNFQHHVFINCPAMSADFSNDDNSITSVSSCYENCRPTKVCNPKTYDSDACVPDGKTVNCTIYDQPNGNRVVSVRIDSMDIKLTGLWSCTYQGLRSSQVKATHKPELKTVNDKSDVEIYPPQTVDNSNQLVVNKATNQIEETENINAVLAPKVQMASFETVISQSPWGFVLLGIFILSLVINMIFVLRWCMMCVFADRRKRHHEEQKFLRGLLCIPTQGIKNESALYDSSGLPRQHFERFHNNAYLPDNAINPAHFSTFTPGYIIDNPVQFEADENRFGYTDSSIRVDQLGGLYRTRSSHFSPTHSNCRDWNLFSNQNQNINVLTGKGSHPSLVELSIPAPLQYTTRRTTPHFVQNVTSDENVNVFEASHQITDSCTGFVHQQSEKQPSSIGTIYDEVASGSSMSMTKNNNANYMYSKCSLQNSQLPVMRELVQGENSFEYTDKKS